MSIIGIDLGTTYSAISKWTKTPSGHQTASVYNIPSQGNDYLSSKIYLDGVDNNGEINFIVGSLAGNKGVMHPDRYVSAVKREMDTNAIITLDEKEFTPVDLSAEIIKMLLKQAENVEGPGTWIPEGVVVTVPYYFKQPQNINTAEAVKKAIRDMFGERAEGKGINVDDIFLNLVPEPVSAGLDFSLLIGNNDGAVPEETFLVFDLGGGTFDLSLFKTKVVNNKLSFEILGVSGDDRLGGEDFDSSLLKFVLKEEGIDLSAESDKDKKRFYKKISQELTSCKEALTTTQTAELIIPMAIGMRNIEFTITRSDFEKCLNGERGDKINYLGKLKGKLDDLLIDTNISCRDVTSVLLTGGSSQIPVIRELLLQYFPKERIRSIPNVNLAVCRGASAYAAYLLDKRDMANNGGTVVNRRLSLWEDIEITEVQSHSLGINTAHGFVMMLKANTITPNTCVKIYHPNSLSEDGEKARISEITILQGERRSHVEIGKITIGDIYTHGRNKENIPIRITFIAESTDVKVKVFVTEGNSDKSDIDVEKSIKLSDS